MTTLQTAETFHPRDEKDVQEAVVWALGSGKKMAIKGRNSRQWMGYTNRIKPDALLDMQKLDGLIAYEPAELFVALRPGTSVRMVKDLLRQQGQMMAFEPLDLDYLFDAQGQGGTMGGLVASGLAGSRRLKAGSVRDHVLGFRAVSGRGEVFKSGGRVVKNVTGYDVSKLMTGSFGTLAAMTELVVKTLPRPQSEASLFFSVPTIQEAAALARKAWRAPLDASYFGFFSASLDIAPEPTDGGWWVVVGMDGAANALDMRLERMAQWLEHKPSAIIREHLSQSFWNDYAHIRHGHMGKTILRVHLKPTDATSLAEQLPEGLQVSFDWAGGMAWLWGDQSEVEWHDVMAVIGGLSASFVIVRDGHHLKERFGWRQEPDIAVKNLERRMRHAFDPQEIFCPQRFFD